MISLINYIEAIFRNVSCRWRGRLLKLYLIIHGCKVGKGLKCSTFPYFKGFPNKNVFIGDYVDLGRNTTIELCDEGKLILEDYVLFNENTFLSCSVEIKIKKWAAIAENVSIRDSNHTFGKNEYYRKQKNVSIAIEIGEDVGVGAGCIILMGAKIAKSVYIGANSVVTRKTTTEENGIYAGNILKLITKRV